MCRDRIEVTELYDLIKQSTALRLYDRDKAGISRHRMEMIHYAMSALGPHVQVQRMVGEYVEQFYTPVVAASRRLNALSHGDARSLPGYKARVRSGWNQVAAGHVMLRVGDVATVGDNVTFHVGIRLGNLRPGSAEVQVVFNRATPDDSISKLDVYVINCTGEEDKTFKHGLIRALTQAGPYGYQVHIVPRSSMIDCYTKLGLTTNTERAADSPDLYCSFGNQKLYSPFLATIHRLRSADYRFQVSGQHPGQSLGTKD